MNYKEKLINGYPLTNKIDIRLECYFLDKRRYLIFYDSLINKSSIHEILNMLQEETDNLKFSQWKTLIVVGRTNDNFQKKELFYFNGESAFVVFYLLNEQSDKIFFDDSWIFALGCNYKKYIRRMNLIMNKGEK